MEIPSDFKELLELLNAHKVDYIIVGGYALAFHGAPRYTGDLDIYVRPDRENAERVLATISEFGFGSLDLAKEDFEAQDNVIQLGRPPVRVDLITSLTGITWEEVFSGRVKEKFGEVPVYFIGKEQLIKNKRALGRKRDLADLEALGKK
jgi:hypothetical protein